MAKNKVIKTVGELKAALAKVPDDMPILSTWESICPPIWELQIDEYRGRSTVFLYCDQSPPHGDYEDWDDGRDT